MFGIGKTLKVGSLVFGLSAIFLILAPTFFLNLLSLESESKSLIWSMQMIGITLIALAGNMWANSDQQDINKVRFVGLVMSISAIGLGVLTLVIPADLNWFSIFYAAIGFLFGLNYLICLVRKRY